jgi:hypothetical protein
MLKDENNMEKCHYKQVWSQSKISDILPFILNRLEQAKNPSTSARSHSPRLDLAEWLEHMTANVEVPASSGTVESEGRQMKQCWIQHMGKKSQKISCLKKSISHYCPFNETSRSLGLATTSKNSCFEVNSTLSSKTAFSCTLFLYLSYLFSPVFVHFKATVANRTLRTFWHQSHYFEVRVGEWEEEGGTKVHFGRYQRPNSWRLLGQ